MKAIILAAGQGTRLRPLTLEKPKCLVELGGKSIIGRLVETIQGIGIEDILVVVGHMKEMLIDHLGNKARYREYPDFEKTNNLHTLWSARDELDGEFMCFFSDILIQPESLKKAKEATDDICLLVDTKQVLEGTMRVKINDDAILGVGGIPVEEGSGNFIGIAKFSNTGAHLLREQMKIMLEGHEQDYYTIAVDALAKQGKRIGYTDLCDAHWAEIDTLEDLNNAKRNLIQYL